MSNNIGFIISACLYDGGAERVIANLSNQLIDEVSNVVIITPSRDEHDYYIKPDIKRYYYEDAVDGDTPRLFRAYRRIKFIRKICQREKLDVLIGFLPGAVTYCSLATLGINTKSILSERNDPNRTYPTLKRRIWGKFVFSLADYVVFQTPDARSWFPKHVQLKSEIILNPVADVFYTTPRHPETNLFVSCGRLVEQKNQHMLIEAFSKAYDKCHDIKLYIYGEGYMHEELQSHIDKLGVGDIIILCGAIKNVQEALAKADFFVLSSDFEGAPNALMEAMAMGIPSISTDCPCGGPKMLNNGKQIIDLVPVGDVDAMAKAICRLALDKKYAISLAESSKEHAHVFTAKAVKNKWLDIINKLTK